VQQDGYLPGCHSSRGGWLSVLLDGTVELDEVCERLRMSFEATAPAAKRHEARGPKEWLVPAIRSSEKRPALAHARPRLATRQRPSASQRQRGTAWSYPSRS
jgi:hypothetical protein